VLAAALSPAEWQRFAEDYLARAIRYPDGRPLPSRPFTGDIYEWIDSFEHVIQARPFVLARATLEFSCGLWGLTAAMSPETTRFQDEGGSWGPLPDRLAVADGEARQLQMAGFASGPDGFRVAVTGSKNPCQACSEATSATEVEHCLIGRWELLAGGYGEQVERDLSAIFQSVQYPDLHRYLHLEASGVYRQLPGEGGERGAVTNLSPGGKLWAGRYRLSYETQGQWSAEGDRLTLCETGRSVRSDATIIDPDGREELIRFGGGGWKPNPEPFPYRRQLQCSDDSLILKEGAVTWHYRRTE